MQAESFLAQLNPQQREAVLQTEGPVLIIAGAGSGKTRTITYRIAYLLRYLGVAPTAIFAATFTNKAAEEMKERVARLIGSSAAAPLYLSTFHSLCARLLRRESHKLGFTNRFSICDETDQRAILRDVIRRLDLPADELDVGTAQDYISKAKSHFRTPSEVAEMWAEHPQGDLYAQLYEAYQAKLKANDALDFDDLLVLTVRLFEDDAETLRLYQDTFRYLLVDEYQDTNLAQFRLLQLLADRHHNLCAVGDEDQSIYSWRGAEISNLLDFQKHFPEAKVLRLEQNYRSTANIIAASAEVIHNNQERLGKRLWTDKASGAPLGLILGHDGQEEALKVVEQILALHRIKKLPLSEIAVFYRTNALSRSFEEELRAENIPYRVVGGVRFYDRAEVKDLIAYLKLVLNPNDSFSLQRIINTPRRGLGQKGRDQLEKIAAEQRISLFAAVKQAVAQGLLPNKPRAALAHLVKCVESWNEVADSMPLGELFQKILTDTAYAELLEEKGDLDSLGRKENIEELGRSIEQFVESDAAPNRGLSEYLERVALASSVDEIEEGEDCVSLMTLHCAKGLEFRAVFIVALEEPLLPNLRAMESSGSLEEERRLFYVGITRAKEYLYLTRADSRVYYGQRNYNLPSVFLREIPISLLEEVSPDRFQWIEDVENSAATEEPSRPKAVAKSNPLPEISAQGRREHTRSSRGLEVGQLVRHPFLGEGQIARFEGSGPNRRVVLRFPEGIEQSLLERYADLTPLVGEE